MRPETGQTGEAPREILGMTGSTDATQDVLLEEFLFVNFSWRYRTALRVDGSTGNNRTDLNGFRR